MNLPDYWLTRPAADLTDDTRRGFDALLEETLARGGNAVIDYRLAAPKWQFLCYVADYREMALHGSGEPAIDVFEPRQSSDLSAFGRQRAVYAAADGLWPMYFAIVDRERHALTLSNACVRLSDPSGQVAGPFYFFSISQAALAHQPWRSGTVYLLPRAPFMTQPSVTFGDSEVHIAQLASLEPVAPLARLIVEPEDFPFLHQIRGHDDARLEEYANALQTGAELPE